MLVDRLECFFVDTSESVIVRVDPNIEEENGIVAYSCPNNKKIQRMRLRSPEICEDKSFLIFRL